MQHKPEQRFKALSYYPKGAAVKALYVSSICVGLLLASAASQAGTVNVVFVHPENFTDIRDSDRDAGPNLKILADYFQWLGQKYLPPEKTVKIEVLDVDLAGRLVPSVRLGNVRVLGKPVDWPEINLRYTVEVNDQVVSSGEDKVADMGYNTHMDTFSSGEKLSNEKQMLKTWFRSHFESN